MIRSIITYSAAAFYNRYSRPSIINPLHVVQSDCVRTVTGAYKATPIHILETKAKVPLVDLYLKEKVAQFELRIEQSGIASQIWDECTPITQKLWI